MRYPDPLRAAPWTVLAVTVWGSGTGTVLLGLAQRFTSQETNAPRTTPMRPAGYRTKFAELSFLLLLAAAVAAGVDVGAAEAFDAVVTNARAPDHLWCVTHEGGDVPAACQYGNFLTCSMAAIMAGGSCKERSSLYVTAGGVALPRPRRPSAAKLRLQKRASHRRQRRAVPKIRAMEQRGATVGGAKHDRRRVCRARSSRDFHQTGPK
jgi:hypothetical protein